MQESTIRVLLIEDSSAEAQRITALVAQGHDSPIQIQITTIDSTEPLCFGSLAHSVDIVLLDVCNQGRFEYELFGRVRAGVHGVPVVVLADRYDEALASMVIGSGAQDFLVKQRLDSHLLVHSIQYSIQRYQIYTQLEQRVREFQAGEARLLNVVLNTADGIVVVDQANVVRFVNPAAEQVFGRKAECLIGKAFEYEVDVGETRELVVRRSGGKPVIAEIRVVETTWEDAAARLISVRDISPRKNAERALRESEERYAVAIRGAKEGVWDWDLDHNHIFFGQQWKEMLGYGDEEFGSEPAEWFSRIMDEDRPLVERALQEHLSGRAPSFEAEYRMAHRTGEVCWMLCRATALRTQEGKPYRIAGSQLDITERKNAEEELRHALSDLQFALASEKVLMEELDRKNRELIELSITDGLTHLFNHRFLQERFDFEFKRVKRYGGNLSCMMIDIDHFKLVNDTYGHQFGDVVLMQVAELIKANSREVDICGRYGGEEFMVLSNHPVEGALKHATKIHKAIEAYGFIFESRTIHVTVSIGISDVRTEVKTKQELIDRADIAMYEAKDGGRNLIRVWKEQEGDEQIRLDKVSINSLKGKFLALSSDMRAAYIDATNAMVKAVEAKDPHTRGHSQNVADYAVRLAEFLNLPPVEIEVIKYAAMLHDVGKIGVAQEILTKKGALSGAEFELLKKHPVIGVSILKDVRFLEKEIPLILHHHERHDGKGYPQGLIGREVPLGARILAVIDAFEAMTAGRTYRASVSVGDALVELQRGKGAQFDPELVDAFVQLVSQEPQLFENHAGLSP